MHESHPLKQAVTNFYVNKDAGKALYDLAMDAESRYKGKDYSLEHLEFTVVRAHYLVQAAHDGEVTWALRGELISTAMSMGLHRDPSQWAMLPEIAERRRWLWWHVLSFERWQAFLLGRPLSVANHHFDTELPSAQFEPAPGMSGCTYVAALVSFRLAAVLGGMVDDALALRPVPYEDVQQHDRALVQWMEELPSEWEFSETQLAAHLRADDLGCGNRTCAGHVPAHVLLPHPVDAAPAVRLAVRDAARRERPSRRCDEHGDSDQHGRAAS
jgi:hypothetical protein